MSSTGSTSSSIGGGSSTGTSETYNDDGDVTGVRGRIDDMVRHLGQIRDRITPDNWPQVSRAVDDADELIEDALDTLLGKDQG